jgi:hypothetical protein
MPLTGIRLLFETLVQRTRMLCKCERREIGSKDCNEIAAFLQEPAHIPWGNTMPRRKIMMAQRSDAGQRGMRFVIRRHERAPIKPRPRRFRRC